MADDKKNMFRNLTPSPKIKKINLFFVHARGYAEKPSFLDHPYLPHLHHKYSPFTSHSNYPTGVPGAFSNLSDSDYLNDFSNLFDEKFDDDFLFNYNPYSESLKQGTQPNTFPTLPISPTTPPPSDQQNQQVHKKQHPIFNIISLVIGFVMMTLVSKLIISHFRIFVFILFLAFIGYITFMKTYTKKSIHQILIDFNKNIRTKLKSYITESKNQNRKL